MREVELAVVGAGPGGCAAAVQALRLGVRPLVLDSEGRAGGLLENARLVENYPGLEKPVTGPELAGRMREHLERFGVEVERGRVDTCTPSTTFLLTGPFGELRARCVILAVGTAPRPLNLPGEAALLGSLLFYEVKHLLPRPPSRVLVIGGGEAAFDYSLSLAGAGARVEMCIRAERPAARGRLFEQVSADPRITLSTRTESLDIRREGEGVCLLVRSESGQRTLSGGALLVAAGRTSAAACLLPPGELPRGLFVFGDARRGALGQAGSAVGDGLDAARAAVDFLQDEAR
ncbi:MAG: NAD(P)/FAD-dependent oxidoreductase [Myxococcaceae bacterium]